MFHDRHAGFLPGIQSALQYVDFGITCIAHDPARLLGLLTGLTHEQDRIALILRDLANFCLELRELEVSRRRQVPLRILGGRPHVDHRGVTPVDQLNGFRSRNTAAAAPDKRRPKQQPTRNEGDRDKNKVGVIGEKLHVGTAGLGVWKNERSKKIGTIQPL